VSFYTRVGIDKVIMRTKGSSTKYTIKNGQNFVKLGLHQLEWQGCVKFAQAMRDAICETGTSQLVALPILTLNFFWLNDKWEGDIW
jgi:hypothetical protein